MRRVSSKTLKRNRTQIRTALHRALLLVALAPLPAVATRCLDRIGSGRVSATLIGEFPVTEEDRQAGRTGPRGYYRTSDGHTLIVDCSNNTSSGNVMLGESA